MKFHLPPGISGLIGMFMGQQSASATSVEEDSIVQVIRGMTKLRKSWPTTRVPTVVRILLGLPLFLTLSGSVQSNKCSAMESYFPNYGPFCIEIHSSNCFEINCFLPEQSSLEELLSSGKDAAEIHVAGEVISAAIRSTKFLSFEEALEMVFMLSEFPD